MRNRIVLLLSLSSFASAAIDTLLSLLGPPTAAGQAAWIEFVLGIFILLYWLRGESEIERRIRPLGVTALAVEFILVGVLVALAGIVLLFLPIFGIIGVAIIALGAGLVYVGKWLWEGSEWGLWISTILVIIAVVLGIGELPFRLGNPVVAIFQLWYLRLPHVQGYFHEYTTTSRIAVSTGQPPPVPGLPLRTKVCETCGGKNPPTSMYCFTCGLRLFLLPDSPSSTEDENSLRLRLERIEDELRKMDKVQLEGKVVDPELFRKAYSTRSEQISELRARLSSLAGSQ